MVDVRDAVKVLILAFFNIFKSLKQVDTLESYHKVASLALF